MWIEQWLDLVGYEVTLEKMCFKSLSEWRSRIYGEEKEPFSEGLSVCGWHTKRDAVSQEMGDVVS